MSYLTDYEEIDGGYVAFGGNPKGGKITGKDAKSLLEAIEKRLQKLVSQLELLKEIISQEDVNQKFLRSLPSEWNMHVVVGKNKPDLDSISMDDLYNNLKEGSSILMGMRWLPLIKQRWNVTISIRGATLQENVEHQEHKTTGTGRAQEGMCLLKLLTPQLWCLVMDLESLNKLTDSQIMDNCKKGLEYNAAPPTHTGLFMPPKPNLSYIGLEEFTSEPSVETLNAKTSEDVPKVVKKDNGAPIIENWKSDDE
nr:hypothetical protein [Tanacetum cinerariifolium]